MFYTDFKVLLLVYGVAAGEALLLNLSYYYLVKYDIFLAESGVVEYTKEMYL